MGWGFVLYQGMLFEGVDETGLVGLMLGVVAVQTRVQVVRHR